MGTAFFGLPQKNTDDQDDRSGLPSSTLSLALAVEILARRKLLTPYQGVLGLQPRATEANIVVTAVSTVVVAIGRTVAPIEVGPGTAA